MLGPRPQNGRVMEPTQPVCPKEQALSLQQPPLQRELSFCSTPHSTPARETGGSLHPVGTQGPGSLATYLRGDGATELADEGKLVLLRVALHDRAAGPHLRHDAPGTPQVNGGAVVPLPWEEERTRRAP